MKMFHILNNIEITNNFNFAPRLNGVFSRNNLSVINDETYVINFNDKNSKGKHWVLIFLDRNVAVHSDSFGI